jgi:hypothetical protein
LLRSCGIVPIKAVDFGGTLPNSTESTAFAVNYKLLYQHACFDGKISYLSNQSSDYPNSGTYDMRLRPINQWLTGGWWTECDDYYSSDVKGFISSEPWLASDF